MSLMGALSSLMGGQSLGQAAIGAMGGSPMGAMSALAGKGKGGQGEEDEEKGMMSALMGGLGKGAGAMGTGLDMVNTISGFGHNPAATTQGLEGIESIIEKLKKKGG